jgi:kynurenine formamidase
MIFNSDKYEVDFNKGIDLSITLRGGENNPRAWYVEPPRFVPVRTDDWTGVVKEGGSVNFRDIFFNPHGHGTHTECLGHITPEIYSINALLKTHFFEAELVSIQPSELIQSGQVDRVILAKDLSEKLENKKCDALIIRTLPNDPEKLHKNYSATNPPYMHTDCLAILKNAGVKHLLIDLPSVDRELDGGVLAFHHGFWEVPDNPQMDKTITEFIFVPEEAKDGRYLLNLQVAPFENDAAPSRPVIFELIKK